jgi:hypothetical protein
MKIWHTEECLYWELKNKLNELEQQGYVIIWIHSPANNSTIQIVCYKEK